MKNQRAKERIESRLAALRILVIGSLNVDHNLAVEGLPDDDGSARVARYKRTFGGHAGNCAFALARLGVQVAVLGAVGQDNDGFSLLADLEHWGVDTRRVLRLHDQPTGHVTIPSFPNGRYMLMYRGANDLRARDYPGLEEVVKGFSAVIMFDLVPDFLDAVFHYLQDQPCRLYWNPGGLLAHDPWTLSRIDRIDVLIVNRAEARALFGEAHNGAGLRDATPYVQEGRCLIETLGDCGARLHAQGSFLHVPAWPVNPVDATGAGDTFTAYFAAMESAGYHARTALLFANKAGALVTEQQGARDGIPDLQSLLQTRRSKRPSPVETPNNLADSRRGT